MLQQAYYEMLTRIDHPVFDKTMLSVDSMDEDTPFNHVLNALIAKQMVLLNEAKEDIKNNSYVHTVTETGIDRWEDSLFGFTKPQSTFPNRKNQLIERFNENVTMSLPDVIALAEQITGITPGVVMNAFFQGWTLDDPDFSVLDISTVFASDNQATDSQLYLVIFPEPVDATLLKRLDEELTLIEKVGSRHDISAPPKFWVLDESTLSIDTTLG